MCHTGCIIFGAKNLAKNEIEGKRVIEVGSADITGSLRSIIELMRPSSYIGVDLEKARGVDIVCRAEDLLKRFKKESFDLVIATELLEHVKDWKKVISNFKNLCNSGGTILITTRSFGYPYHSCPYDFWRYESEDMENIFADCQVLILEKDYQFPGVFLKVKKPKNFCEKDLSNYKLYSMVTNKRVKEVADRDLKSFYYRHLILKQKIKNLMVKINSFIFSKI